MALLLLPFAVFAQEDDTETAPTGKIAYVNPTQLSTGGELYLLDLDNRNQATRISPEGDDRKDISPIFSPDGGRIAFQSNGRLAFTTPSGGEPIVTDITRSRHIAWASDNSRVAFLTPNVDRFNLNVFSVDTNELKTYENTSLFINDPANPTWSLDGTTIFFSAFEPEKNGDIYSISADFETLTNITNSPDLAESSPSVSPNGLYISYKVEFDGAGGDVWVMGIDGSNPRNLTNGGLILGSPDTRHWWSPDSTRVMIPDAGRGIAIINNITGEITDFEGENPTWSPDGLWVAYTRFRVNRDNITYVDLY
ncbi:MAG TPA: hypothetical protein PLZ51_15370, partial [Aggregatilineales bacterium]|nr:hypothetical protein [Aggregatilineales bacterium]